MVSNMIEASIIIPSYNKYPLNILTLWSLERQLFDFSKMEVILIADGSTDETTNIGNVELPFHFRFIELKENVGRARARNIGAELAFGNILIFLDAEMLVPSNFVSTHFHHHISNSTKIVTGALEFASLYSHLFSEFTKRQVKQAERLVKGNDNLWKRIQSYRKYTNEPFPILTKSDLEDDTLRTISFKRNFLIKEMGTNFSSFRLPWLAFLSGNVSLTKASFNEAGGFDESFKGYGWEDRELGYRLHKLGKQFIFDRRAVSYHQEHPVTNAKIQESLKNLLLFQEKHEVIEVYILVMEFLGVRTTYNEMHEIIREYHHLCENYPIEFQKMKLLLPFTLKTITEQLAKGVKLGELKMELKKNHLNDLLRERGNLKRLKKYPHLISVIDKIAMK